MSKSKTVRPRDRDYVTPLTPAGAHALEVIATSSKAFGPCPCNGNRFRITSNNGIYEHYFLPATLEKLLRDGLIAYRLEITSDGYRALKAATDLTDGGK